MKTQKNDLWKPLIEGRHYKKKFLIRKIQDKEAEKEVKEFVENKEELPTKEETIGTKE